jgi:single-strand DNA-binding protein
MFHRVTIVGNLGVDPEVRYLPDGTPVANFRVAANTIYTDPTTKERKEVTIWFRVSAWGKLAEQCKEHLTKGRLVLVEGRLIPDESGNPRTWVGNDGTVRASYEVKAQTVRFLGPRPEALPTTEGEETEEE